MWRNGDLMRQLGYVLLIGGFLWLAHEAFVGLAPDQYAATFKIAKGMERWGEQLPRPLAHHALWEQYNQLRPRNWVTLLPAAAMLAGGLLLGAPKKAPIVINRVFTRPQDIQPRVDEVRRDYTAVRQPEKGVGYRRRLLQFVRRTIAGSAYFRARKPGEHDKEGP